MSSKRAPAATFDVRFIAPNLSPELLPLRTVNEALSAVQDLASGRDPYECSRVPVEKSIGLVKVRRGSAVYSCVSHSPDEAVMNLTNIGALLSSAVEETFEDDGLVAALRPIKSLSDVAKQKDAVELPGKTSGKFSPALHYFRKIRAAAANHREFGRIFQLVVL